jgi:hypothetical protein
MPEIADARTTDNRTPSTRTTVARKLRVVGVSGSLKAPSRTIALVDAIIGSIGEHLDIEPLHIRIN